MLCATRRHDAVVHMIRGTPIARAVLLRAARAYAKATRLPLRKVSRRVYGDDRFLGKLSRGGPLTFPAYDKTMGFFGHPNNWPSGAVPRDVTDLFAPVAEKQFEP